MTNHKTYENPANYKTDFGLYKAFVKALEYPYENRWFIHNTIDLCRRERKELLPQIIALINIKKTINDNPFTIITE